MSGRPLRLWRWPLVLNGAIVAGLAMALLVDTTAARMLACGLIALPPVVAGVAFAKGRLRDSS